MLELELPTKAITRRQLIDLLNEDLSREILAVAGYVNSSKMVRETENLTLAASLKSHAEAELAHAVALTIQIDTLGGAPKITQMPVRTSNNPQELIRFDIDTEASSIANYRIRVQQCEELGEHTVADSLRQILHQEQEHLSRLMVALKESGLQCIDSGCAVVRSLEAPVA